MADASGVDPVPSETLVSNIGSQGVGQKKKNTVCRFYGNKSGCRAGQDCRFLHPSDEKAQTDQGKDPQVNPYESSTQQGSRDAPNAIALPASRVVTRPVPKAQTEDPRAFQIAQIQRRFKPVTSEKDGFTVLSFGMQPSDPDFPYEIDELECVLSVPSQYPTSASATISIKNKDIPRGFQINIERGFDTIAANAPGITLLNLMKRIDNQLESILSGQMAETVKIVPNRVAPKPSSDQVNETRKGAPTPQQPVEAENIITQDHRDQAKGKRRSDVRQLEARFGRLQLYAKSSDGTTYTLPLESPKRSTWPTPLQSLKTVHLKVPESYPLAPAEVELHSESDEARAVGLAFKDHAFKEKHSTLTQQINYLIQNLKSLAVSNAQPENKEPQPVESIDPIESQPLHEPTVDNDKAHIRYIPRPPEWDTTAASDTDADSEADDSFEETADEEEADLEGPQDVELSYGTAPVERGILLSFPHLELHGIELLELVSLNITVKCERCKDTMDVERLRSATEDSKEREVSCKKCATTFGIKFRADLIHVNSVRGGYLDLDGCTVVDMLPSNFIPTCSECSTSYPAPGVSAVRGDAAMAICREDHRKMTFRILEVKFLQVSQSAVRASRVSGQKKVKENLGITAGTELPRQGRCTHYKKSFRWFRFSCCNRVFPCDRCHDEQNNDHAVEFANRMICGFCKRPSSLDKLCKAILELRCVAARSYSSREQNYRPEDCGICHAALTGKKGRGFWEGGRGTRDPMRMSRKDPRKYKRRPGTKPKT